LYLAVIATRIAERLGPALVPWLPAGWSLTRDVLNGAGRIEFHHLAAVGRALAALVDVGTVFFIFLLGRRLFSSAVGLLAAAFLAVTVLHTQLAHFFTSDPFMTFFIVAALYFMAAAQTDRAAGGASECRVLLNLCLAGAATGLAVGSKFSAVLLVLPLLWASLAVTTHRRWLAVFLPLAVAAVIFAVANPFALLDWTCAPPEGASFLARSCYFQNVMTQNAMVRGQVDLAFTRQYDGTLPYLYFIEMLLRWGIGPILGALGFAGLVWAIWRVVSSLGGAPDWRGALALLQRQPLVTLLLWTLPYFILTGSFYVKFLRYMQPIIPFLLLFGAAMVWQWRSEKGRLAVVGLSLGAGLLYALAFVAIYRAEHPWNAASRWIFENVPPGTTILSEQYDDYLPVPLMVNGEERRRAEYPNVELTWLASPDEGDDEAKLAENLKQLAGAEYLTVLSNRVYGVAPRMPQRYPLSGRFHQLLFDGALGYELVWVGGRYPQLFSFSLFADTFGWPGLQPPAGAVDYLTARPGWSPGRADESFIVYDQPLTMIFRNTGYLTAEQMRAAFDLSGE
jgi:hypothetical protein